MWRHFLHSLGHTNLRLEEARVLFELLAKEVSARVHRHCSACCCTCAAARVMLRLRGRGVVLEHTT